MEKRTDFKTEKTVIFLYIFSLLPFIGITGIGQHLNAFAVQVWQALGFYILSAFTVYYSIHAKIRLDGFTVSVILFFAYSFLITSAKHSLSVGILFNSVFSVLITILIQIDFKRILKAVKYILTAGMIINLILMFVYGTAEDKIYFLGGKNHLLILMIPTIFVIIIDALSDGRKTDITDFFLIFLCLLTVVMGKSATGILVIAVVFLMLIFSRFIKRKAPLIGIVSAVYLILLTANTFFYNSAVWLKITDFLGKSSNLTGRTEIWAKATELIRQNPVFGNGKGTEVTYRATYGVLFQYTEAHNIVIEILLSFGLVGFVIYVFYIYKTVKPLDLTNRLHKTAFLFFISFFLNGLTESVCNLTIYTISIAFIYAVANTESEVAEI